MLELVQNNILILQQLDSMSDIPAWLASFWFNIRNVIQI